VVRAAAKGSTLHSQRAPWTPAHLLGRRVVGGRVGHGRLGRGRRLWLRLCLWLSDHRLGGLLGILLGLLLRLLGRRVGGGRRELSVCGARGESAGSVGGVGTWRREGTPTAARAQLPPGQRVRLELGGAPAGSGSSGRRSWRGQRRAGAGRGRGPPRAPGHPREP
jgi:hypothetical protein